MCLHPFASSRPGSDWKKPDCSVQKFDMATTLETRPISPCNPNIPLAAWTAAELVAECLDAGEAPFIDKEGSAALLAEVSRRKATGELSSEAAASCIALLETVLALTFGNGAEKSRALAAELRQAWDLPSPRYVYHGTLASRLSGIAKEGLIPRRKSKRWGMAGVDDHASQGVYFTLQWRQAVFWLGASSYDSEGRPVRGAVVRVPRAGLPLQPDRLALAPGAVVARLPVVPVAEAEVMLFPFTVGSQWLPLPTAVEHLREKRRLARPVGERGLPRRSNRGSE